jgi:phage shock protein PspC (stress-responsive transcriptional regulator)
MERNQNKGIVAGVAAGLNERTGVSLLFIRIGFIAGFFLFGLGFFIYLFLWWYSSEGNNQIQLKLS